MKKPRLRQIKSLIQDTESGAGLGCPGADVTLLLATLLFAPTLGMKGQQGFWMEKVKRAVFSIKAAGSWWLWFRVDWRQKCPPWVPPSRHPLLSWSPAASAAGPQPPLPPELTLSIQAGDAEAHRQPLPASPPGCWLCASPPRWPGMLAAPGSAKAKLECAAPAERADLTKPPARPFQVADRRLGRESGACAHDIPGDKDISGLAAGGSDAVPPCWELPENGRHWAPRPFLPGSGWACHNVPDPGSQDFQNIPPWTGGLQAGGCVDCSEPTKWAQLPAGDSWYFSGLLCSVFFCLLKSLSWGWAFIYYKYDKGDRVGEAYMTVIGGLFGPSSEPLCDFCSVFCCEALEEIAAEVICWFARQQGPGVGFCAWVRR